MTPRFLRRRVIERSREDRCCLIFEYLHNLHLWSIPLSPQHLAAGDFVTSSACGCQDGNLTGCQRPDRDLQGHGLDRLQTYYVYELRVQAGACKGK